MDKLIEAVERLKAEFAAMDQYGTFVKKIVSADQSWPYVQISTGAWLMLKARILGVIDAHAAALTHDAGTDEGLRKPTDIGNLRGYLFAPFDCKWNGIVRDVTAEHEHDGECDAYAVFKNLVQIVRDNGQLDHSFPARMRLEEMFDVSPYGDEEVYVAWLRWAGDENHRHLVVCDSDDERAFKVYRRPTSPDSRACRPSTRQ
jgi:hypothetical protein